jgi:hypothetical protein
MVRGVTIDHDYCPLLYLGSYVSRHTPTEVGSDGSLAAGDSSDRLGCQFQAWAIASFSSR